MWGRPAMTTPAIERPVLDLSGPRLAAAFEDLIAGAEDQGGIERYVTAVALKASLFHELLGEGRAARLSETDFRDLCVFIAPARRRIAGWQAGEGFARLREALAALLTGETATTEARLAAFAARFPDGPKQRWVRDLAAEALHFTLPEKYPLMTRWVWDHATNSGVLREIWFGDDVDRMRIEVPDSCGTFLMLREELSGFLSRNGVYRDVPFYVDLLCAKVYADYINAQGGAYLRVDFASADDPMQYVRRMLGLDGIATEAGRARLKLIDGRVFGEDPPKLLS